MLERDKQSIELEDLLKLKRHEKPDEAFWETFESEMEAKQLKALVGDSDRGGSLRMIGRWVGWALPFASAVAIFAGLYLKNDINFQSETTVSSIREPMPEVPMFSGAKSVVVEPEKAAVDFQMAGSRGAFVVDDLSVERKREHYHRVLYDRAMVVPVSTGARYVADQLTSNLAGDAVVLNVHGNGHF